MGEPQFTPGPWHVFSRGIIYIAAQDRTVIAAIEPDPTAMHLPHGANARLMAAAPALYEALDELMKAVGPEACKRGRRKALAALSLALGEKQDG